MAKTRSSFTVFFEEPFWVGVYERTCGQMYEVCKITFGAEPKDCEVYEFLLQNFVRLPFGSSANESEPDEPRRSPKRMQREINRQLQAPGMGTKAQQALKLQHEQQKKEHAVCSREKREEEKDRQFHLRQEKRKEKHRGH